MIEEQYNNTTGSGSDFFVFAVTTVQPLLHTLEAQIEGASQATDIECIHKMRVTSRRIRAALFVFKSCFPKETARRWRQEIRNITQSLGAARDMDVQILFLEDHLHTLSDPIEKSGIEYLLTQHRQRRAALQPDVVKHLQRLKESGVLEEMYELSKMIPSKESPGSSHSFATYTAAQEHIRSCFTDFLSLQDYVDKEDEIKKHHEMRIAAKHLRYTMELFSPLYDTRLASYITMMKEFQDILGEMHDCDVWCAYIPTVLDNLKRSLEDTLPDQSSNQEKDIEAGLTSFLQFIRSRRHELYTEFTQYWQKNTSNSMLSSLENLIYYSAVIPRSFLKKIAILSDVHGNLDALHAVFEDARKNGAELMVNLGDFVGYGAYPQEVITELHSDNVLSVLGNYDKEVLEWKKNRSSDQGDETEISLEYVVSQLQKPSFQFLKSLPTHRLIRIDEKSVFLTHGSPESINEHIYPDTPEQRLNELSQQANTDVILLGHSHIPFIRTVNQVTFVNPGSVGRPGDNDTRASYALLTVHPFFIELRKVPYDVTSAVDALRQRHLPERFVQMLLQGTSLEQLLHQELLKTTKQQSLLGRSILMNRRNERKKRQIKKVVERYVLDKSHAFQVTRTALLLFDKLRSIHPLGHEDRFWLESAGLLHDIGLSHGAKGHHKTSFQLILTDPTLPLNARERQMIGLIARYHRKKSPSMDDEPYRELSLIDRTRVDLLAALMRVADGLDASHGSIVEKIDMEINDSSVLMRCLVNGNPQREEEMVNKKKDLFEQVFNRSLLITMQETPVPKERSSGS
jgi:putative phosphoesterase